MHTYIPLFHSTIPFHSVNIDSKTCYVLFAEVYYYQDSQNQQLMQEPSAMGRKLSKIAKFTQQGLTYWPFVSS